MRRFLLILVFCTLGLSSFGAYIDIDYRRDNYPSIYDGQNGHYRLLVEDENGNWDTTPYYYDYNSEDDAVTLSAGGISIVVNKTGYNNRDHYDISVAWVDPVMDEYRVNFSLHNNDSDQSGSFELQVGNASSASVSVLPGNSEFVTSSAFFPQGSPDAPTYIGVSWVSLDGQVRSLTASFSLTGEKTDSGGDVYEASISAALDNYEGPEVRPDIDEDDLPQPLPDPPDPPGPPPPPDPDNPFDYDLFRQAVEIALANRQLSAGQFQDAMENALLARGMTQQKTHDAVQAALADQNLDNLSIASAIQDTYGSGGSYSDSSDASNPSLDDYEEGTYQSDLDSINEGVLGKFTDTVGDKITSMFTLDLPDVGQNPVYEKTLPSFLGIQLPALHIDLDQYPFIKGLRAFLVLLLYVGAFFKAIKLVNGAY